MVLRKQAAKRQHLLASAIIAAGRPMFQLASPRTNGKEAADMLSPYRGKFGCSPNNTLGIAFMWIRCILLLSTTGFFPW